MVFIPGKIIRKLYNHGSLRNDGAAVRFSVKNRLSPATLETISDVAVDGQSVDPALVSVAVEQADPQTLERLNAGEPIDFPLGTLLTGHLAMGSLEDGAPFNAFHGWLC